MANKKTVKQTVNSKVDKPKKERSNKYEEKLQINGTFEELVKELITPVAPLKPKQ